MARRLIPLALVVLLAACGAGAHATSRLRKLAPPLIAIRQPDEFTLPCPRTHRQAETTIGIEGCEGAKSRRLEARINAAVLELYRRDARLDATYPRGGTMDFSFRGSARARLIDSERAWQAYAAASCTSAADIYANGSFSLDYESYCEVKRARTHLADLRAQARIMRQH